MAESADEVEKLRAEISRLKKDPLHAKWAAVKEAREEVEKLKAQLAVVTQATTCARRGDFKHTPWRDETGYVCAGCLGKRVEKLRAQVSPLEEALNHVVLSVEAHRSSVSRGYDRGKADASLWRVLHEVTDILKKGKTS